MPDQHTTPTSMTSQQEEEQDEFHEETVLFSIDKGSKFQPKQALLYKDTGIGYRLTSAGKFILILASGYILIPYMLTTNWQAQEACRRIAPLWDFNQPADQVYPTYSTAHNGEKLGDRIKDILIDVQNLADPTPQISVEEHLSWLKNFVLERGSGRDSEHVPPLAI